MRVTRLQIDGRPRAAVIAADGETAWVQPEGVEVLELLTGTREPDRGDARELSPLRRLAPLAPATIRDFSVFEQHIEGIKLGEGQPVPDVWYASPFCYFTNPSDVSGPGDEIAVPPGCRDLDLELEVAAIIGTEGRDLTPEQAVDHIAGYTIFNDWSARDLQFAEMRLGLGICKGKDFANTLGPWIVTPDELAGFRDGDRLDLELRAQINGRELGVDTLAHMAWSFPELVAYASRGTVLRPGDVLGSGTCGAGCLIELRGRHGADAYPSLAPGDTVTLSVQGIGELTNTIGSGHDPVTLPAARRGLHV
jgi:2-keto-4-pentenoate hydratase/2-oxohepta-3-ene-1,7-dioic acid hydratase in catechol pathway